MVLLTRYSSQLTVLRTTGTLLLRTGYYFYHTNILLEVTYPILRTSSSIGTLHSITYRYSALCTPYSNTPYSILHTPSYRLYGVRNKLSIQIPLKREPHPHPSNVVPCHGLTVSPLSTSTSPPPPPPTYPCLCTVQPSFNNKTIRSTEYGDGVLISTEYLR